jgi:hypothetical protein
MEAAAFFQRTGWVFLDGKPKVSQNSQLCR